MRPIAAASASHLVGGDEMFNFYHPDLTTFIEGQALGINVCVPGPGATCPQVASPAHGQAVLLQIRPHIGDTLRMHLSQSVEMTGTTPGGR